MPTENQQHPGINELLDDIRYVNQSAEAEIRRVGDDIRQRIDEAGLTQYVTDFMIDDISTQLGQLAAKVKLTEKAVHSLQSRQRTKTKAETNIAVERKESRSDLSFPANILADNKNMLPMETSSKGISFCWSGADPEIRFSFSLDRTAKLEMQIRMVALIKPEYSKQLKVFIDGTHVKHRFALDGSLFVVSCLLPFSTKTSLTEVNIRLPATHCPTDLGSSLDGRRLGIAISEICFGKPESSFTHLLKRLKLK